MNILKNIVYALLPIGALTACSTETMSEMDRTRTAFIEKVGGYISPMQWWRTAITLNVDLTTNAPTKLWLLSDDDKGILFDYKEVASSGSVKLFAPQGQGNTVYIVTVSNHQKHVQPITLSGKTEEEVKLNLTTLSSATSADNEQTTPSKAFVPKRVAPQAETSLYGSSIKGDATYIQLSSTQQEEAIGLLKRVYKEYTPAKSLGANCDYEVKSNGEFHITWFAGSCLSATPHVLGYYYHSPGTYDDIKYVDLSETEIYDYIDGKAKVQYQVNDEAAAQYGIEANHWYDANFDMYDTYASDAEPSLASRRGDDAFCTMSVFERYGRNLTVLRGISFKINVPEGMCVGFYDRIESTPMPEQYDRFMRLGIKPYTSRSKFKAMNFSCEQMNMNIEGSYRSCVFKTNNAIWLGMENSATGGDLDCNDVMFMVSADLDIHQPTITEPTLTPFAEYSDIMPWTIAYEDIARDADFDFNDAVIRVRPNPEKEECCVTVTAAGSTQKMFLHYDGPDGDINLGEIHNLLGGKPSAPINTTTSLTQTPFVDAGCVKWPKSYTMEQDAKRFYIEVQRGTCSDCTDVITLPDEPGQMPSALLVAGEWKWPREGISVTSAYPTFTDWCKDITKLAYWNWYAYPRANSVVKY